MPKLKKQSKSLVRRIRDQLSRKIEHDSNQQTASWNELYYAHLKQSLHKQLQPSLFRLNGAPQDKDVIYQSAKIDASLKLSHQLYMLDFIFRKFALRWRRIKLQSGLHLWRHMLELRKAHEKYMKVLAYHAIKIQRAYRRRHNYLQILAQKKSLADQLLELVQQNARERARITHENICALQLQKIWRGVVCRLHLHELLAAQLYTTLGSLSIHCLFGHLSSVQVSAAHPTNMKEFTKIQIANSMLIKPYELSIVTWIRVVNEIEMIASSRKNRGIIARAKERNSYWQLLEKQLAQFNLIEWRRLQRYERLQERRRKKQECHDLNRTEARGTRHLLHLQMLQKQIETREIYAMNQEDICSREFMRACKVWEQQLASENMKKSIFCLKKQLQNQTIAMDNAKREAQQMDAENELGYLNRNINGDLSSNSSQSKISLNYSANWMIHIIARSNDQVGIFHQTKMTAITMIYQAQHKNYEPIFSYCINNAVDMHRGLFRQRYTLPKVPTSDIILQKIRRKSGLIELCRVQWVNSDISIRICRLIDKSTFMYKARFSLIAILTLLKIEQMIWLRPRQHFKLFEFALSCATIYQTLDKLILIPPLHISLDNNNKVMSHIPIVQTILQEGWTTFECHLSRINSLLS
ncbi:hypothetical protein THRCLA_02519 [Thraustotheca clavata]|uniref:Uncharacterized protein n=1 Tax=Thraustotheca clavata TaxID=74557 RepID=A0A1W0A4X4_9STRA|nr:hypothetical protein THRCLA_02519 [Thraustotheca clavata]